MASRSSRSGARASPAPGVRPRAPSPLSPTKVSRTEEKKALGNLNDRLAAYIEKVRNLEMDNNRLETQISTIEETNTKEVISVRNMYDKELQQARKALDETAKEKAKWEIEAERHKSASKEAESKFKDRQSELDRLERANKALENQLADVRKKYDSLENDRNRVSEELRNIKPDYDRMKNKLSDAQKNLEDETLKRIDLQNQLQTAQEEAKFNNSVLTQQLNESKVRRQIEIEEMDGSIRDKYDQHLQEKLRELREQYEEQVKVNNDGWSDMYEKRISDLNAKLAGERGAAAGAIQEMKEMSTKVHGMTSRVHELEVTNDALNRRIKELQENLDEQGRMHRNDMAKKDHEIDFLNEQIANQTAEYKELLEIKIALDAEIKTYRTLLEHEESRLGLSQSQIDPDVTDTGRGTKRKRLMETEEYSGVNITTSFTQPGAFLIEPLEEGSNCIQIRNTTDSEESLSGYQLKSNSDGMEVTYKFHRSVKVAPGGIVSVFGSDSGEEHMPAEGRLVMKEGTWKVGNKVDTILINKDGEVQATRETKKEAESFGSSRRFAGRRLEAGQEGDKNCSIM